MRGIKQLGWGALLLAVLCGGFRDELRAAESPTSYGEVARFDTPVLRLPMTRHPPTIDGVMDEGEWEDASALSAFWYDYAQAKFYFLAPIQTQLQLYGAYDDQHLYIAYVSPVYPENSWLRSRGRFPDVTHHPLYGLIWDDHIELELRPYDDLAAGFKLGLFKWFANPYATVADLYWSINLGEDNAWKSRAQVRSGVTGQRWVLEFAIPLEALVVGNYAGKDAQGQPVVKLPPVNGTAFRAWFVRGIGGQGAFFNASDNHCWNTTKTRLVLDSQAPSFQVNDLGPILEDVVDLRLTVKNHNARSETVRLGFFVESQNGMIYSSYDVPELKEGLLELRPGEVRKLRLRKTFPGITTDGNVLWFDVRSGGQPAKSLFRTRLIKFHSMDGGVTTRGEERITFWDRRIGVIEQMRPPRREFEFSYSVSAYNRRIAAQVDAKVHGAPEEVLRATEAKLTVLRNTPGEEVVAEVRAPFAGGMAVLQADLPGLIDQEWYKVSLLLFDAQKRVVGERNPEPFQFQTWEFMYSAAGTNDVVWEPFTPIARLPDGFETLKHRMAVDASGLPAQITIKADPRELPLEARDAPTPPPDPQLVALGRGPQLRAPLRLEAVIGGQRVAARVIKPATLVRAGQSEFEYAAELTLGELPVKLLARYDCDGALRCTLDYGGDREVTVQALEMVMDIAGLVDLKLTANKGGGMAAADVWECSLPGGEGVVWDSTATVLPDLYYSHFIPWLWFGSGDRGFTWFCDSDRNWSLGRDSSSMTLERNRGGEVTWRVKFVSQETRVKGARRIVFHLLTHPDKPKPADARTLAWLHRGEVWADEYPGMRLTPASIDDATLRGKAAVMAGLLSGLRQATPEQLQAWVPEGPSYWRYYQMGPLTVDAPPRPYTEEELKSFSKEKREAIKWNDFQHAGFDTFERYYEDKFPHYLERHLRVGRRHGWWWDETWPLARTANLSEGTAYARPPAEVRADELGWQDGFLSEYQRNMFKRLARVFKEQGLPLRNSFWANNAATLFGSFGWDTMLVEECGSAPRSYELDVMTQFPASLYRYLAHNWSGLVTHLAPDNSAGLRAGDDPRIERQLLGRCLAHEIGLTRQGPHGSVQQVEQVGRLLKRLQEFGFFDETGCEMLPYWRPNPVVRYGAGAPPPARGILEQLAGRAHVTVFRHRLDGGRAGVKALFVIVNETAGDVQETLTLTDAARILGGPNTLKAGAVRAQAAVPPELAAWWAQVGGGGRDDTVLMDLESGDVVAKTPGAGEAYGPVHVPYHDFRVLYAERSEPAR